MNSNKKGPVFEGGTCRCCGITKKCRLLNAEYEFCGQKEVYFEMFVDCFGLVLSHLEGEEMDRLICATCVMRLRDASAFRQQVLQCEEKLLKIQMQVDDDSNKQTKDSEFDMKVEIEECNSPVGLDNDYEQADNAKTYKVVETIANGEKVLTSVPGSWERDGKLKWPRKNKAEKFRNHDKPDDDWDTTNCIVKRRRLATYKDAENVIKSICESGESLSSVVMTQVESNKKHLHGNSQKIDPQKVTATHTITSKKTTSSALKGAISKTPNRTTPLNATNTQMPVIANVMDANSITNAEALNERTYNSTEQINNTCIKQLLSKILRLEIQLKDVSTKIRSVLDNQINLIYNQDNVSLQVEQLSDTFKEFFTRASTEGNVDDQVDFLPVESEEDLEKLENKLKEPEFKMELMKKFSITFGKENGNGANVAYRLIDMFFDRHFLTLCSWSGGSRHYDRKICFRAHSQVIQFFFKIVHASDEEYTLDACENFLKGILRTSVKRSMNRNMRKSTCKKRLKRGKRKLIDRANINERAIEKVVDEHNDIIDRAIEKVEDERNDIIDRGIEEVLDEHNDL
ncbi:unnamed protein product [Diatraea saccharalis]|uniref:ZAD domain-containing protein n=1 Tax=Diatraea saccharalis TaxID=40085 RepID=A0A9N9R4X6_9NEOP|nr:unnamed protein product [Diatraea saccharalis]